MFDLNAPAGFISEKTFRPYQDLDGKAAAEFLIANGAENVTHADKGTCGLAEGIFNGKRVVLSTNGYFHTPHNI